MQEPGDNRIGGRGAGERPRDGGGANRSKMRAERANKEATETMEVADRESGR